MDKTGDNGGTDDPNSDFDSDRGIWEDFVRTIRPLHRDSGDPVPPVRSYGFYRRTETAHTFSRLPPKERTERKITPSPGAGLDRKTADKLRRGKFPVEARLDLHGLRQDEAEQALSRFIEKSYQAGRRCVIVITGKGREQKEQASWWEGAPRGVLRDRVPGWLAAPPFSSYVLGTEPARPEDGGSGALYILLRRKR